MFNVDAKTVESSPIPLNSNELETRVPENLEALLL
jgi:hypothetical protein